MSTVLMTEAIAALRARIGGSLGRAGGDWCDALPTQVARLMALWSLTGADEPASTGFGGIAVPVVRADHSPAVLKVTFSIDSRDLENEVLHAWDGHHAAKLLERDDSQHARLLERLGPPLSTLSDPLAAMSITGELAAYLAVRPPPGLPRIADLAPEIARTLSDAPSSSFRSLTKRDVQAAAATYRDLGSDQPETLLHGDLQGSNVLRSPAGGWAAIDPLGMIGEIGLEALTALRDRWTELPTAAAPRTALLRQLHAFSDGARIPSSRVIAWTHARSVRAVLAGVTDDAGMHEWMASQIDPAAP